MKIKEIRDLADDELAQRLEDLRKELFDLKQRKATGKLEQPLHIRGVRRDIARVNTILNQRRKTV